MYGKTIACLLSCILAGLVAITPVSAGEGDVVAVFKLSGPLPEQPDTSGIGALLGDKAPPNMFNLLKKLRHARADDNLKAVIFEIDQAALGMGQIQEIRAQFEALRAADKDVWVFSENLSNGTLMLGSAASRLVLVPAGEVAFTGLYGEALYFKNTLDKIGMEADILHCGDFKSAGEPFYRTGPSKEAEAQNNRLLDSIFDQMLAAIAKSRRLSEERVRELVDIGVFSSKEALEAKLVDTLQYREDFVKSIKKRYGEETKIVSNYGGEKGLELDLDNPFGIFKLFGDMMKGKDKSDEPAVAVVYVEGAITSGKTEQGLFGGTSNAGSATVRKAISEAAADDSVKALVLRVDSPGGSALASDVICEAAQRFSESGRPFIVSMGNVAASGGYYVSTLADSIFAEPITITGSIGVVGGKIVTKGLWDWAGVTNHEYKRGARADMMNTNRRFSDDEREVVMGFMNRVYGEFKDRVLAGRKSKLTGEIESLAGGRVYTGTEALKIGLVDQLGGFADAIKYAAAEAEVSDYELRVYPRPQTLMDVFSELFGGKESDDDFVHMAEGAVGSRFAAIPTFATAIEALKTIDPEKARVVQDFLIHMELLSGERVLMVGPTFTTVIR
ncbi:MAG: signal peptide peptidase SppA [Phycisphaerae bacterium]